MKEDKIWQMVYQLIDEDDFEVKDGVIRIVDSAHVCMLEIRNVKLKDGGWRIGGKGANRKPVKWDLESAGNQRYYGNSPKIPIIDFNCKISLGSTENIYKILKQMEYIGGLIIMKSNSKTLELTTKKNSAGNSINAIIPTTNIDGDAAHSTYQTRNLTALFQYLNPTSLEFGENFPIKIEGKNWTYFLAPRIENDY